MLNLSQNKRRANKHGDAIFHLLDWKKNMFDNTLLVKLWANTYVSTLLLGV